MTPRKTRFVVLLTGLLVAGFLLTSLVSYWVARDSLSNQLAETTLPLTSDNIYSEIQQDLLRPILISAQMAHDTFVRDWAIEGEAEPERMVRFLAEIKERNGTVSSFFVSDRTRHYYHADGLLRQVSPDEPADAWYFATRDTPGMYEVNVDWDTADRTRLTIFINHKVRDFSGQLLGITGVGLSMDKVKAMLETYRARYGRDVLFVDDTGEVTLHADSFEGPTRLQDWPALRGAATNILTNPSTSFTLEHGGEPVYVNTRLVPEFGWHLLVVQHGDPAQDRLDNTLLLTLLLCAVITAVVLALAHWTLRGYQRRLEEMASTDKLTGAINRQVFDHVYDETARAVARRGTRMAVMLLDIDHFKAINDTHGHQVGDRVIAGVADIIRNALGSADRLCRWGGEEFLVLAPDHDADSARHLAEDIRRRIAGASIPCGDRVVSTTASLGVALAGARDDQDAVVKQADDALYRAKGAGRNRVEDAGAGEARAACA
ncbi:diguanylate cyclase [Caenispirillum salinarum]|uniref:sensor domain-containing diguanylate cyclase n=1 Tax=Caenispirillum salinarum TaxID=859058 RepID=UPI00384A84A9